MKSRFCLTFTIDASRQSSFPLFVHRTLKPPQIMETLLFTVQYWQPFIDVLPRDERQTIVCGPLLGLMMELANQVNAK